MKYTETSIPGVWIIEPEVFGDSRGYFFEAFKQQEFEHHVGPVQFVQENESRSTQGVLRGLHYQADPFPQAKLVRVILGAVLDVAVDLRPGSPTFAQHIAVELSADNKQQLFIPRGFAHGFHVLSPEAVFTYKVDNLYSPAGERTLRYDDPAFRINWQIPDGQSPILSPKDQQAPRLGQENLNK
ncbi:MAG: dTDP-4-dehydrorhamnose 3,5-epimerase [Tannerellaceae bacterium]|jgi:dTDP-4-dehydrorhamnose 3,5-epimerase|nr:dTDP-4-dehydrorhamnose 3,5-epimerase [Tannerellaceae bacterium]